MCNIILIFSWRPICHRQFWIYFAIGVVIWICKWTTGLNSLSIKHAQWSAKIQTLEIRKMPKSGRSPIWKEPNLERSPIWISDSFYCLISGFDQSGRSLCSSPSGSPCCRVRISDSCLKSRCLGTKGNLTVWNPNQFGFWHSTVLNHVRKKK